MHVSVDDAKTNLSRLLDRAAKGEEVIITRDGRPIAKLFPATAVRKPRKLGVLKGRIRVPDDFDAPLPDDVLDAFDS
jgi:prevent-host-death family protein